MRASFMPSDSIGSAPDQGVPCNAQMPKLRAMTLQKRRIYPILDGAARSLDLSNRFGPNSPILSGTVRQFRLRPGRNEKNRLKPGG